MKNIRRLSQAYSQTPWRRQLQLIGLFLLVLILGAMVAGIYLNVTARAATIGRSIQALRADSQVVERQNEDLRTQLALITSNSEMEKRAQAMGFRPVKMDDEVIYLVIPGYYGRSPTVLAQPPAAAAVSTTIQLSQEYTRSLFDWFVERVLKPAAPLMEPKQ